MAQSRPPEELYDTFTDPYELHNLAAQPKESNRLAKMRAVLVDWQTRTGDIATTESEEVYKIEVGAVHAETGKNKAASVYQSNVDLMLRWMKERPLHPSR
jgi:arylsulfatase A-like enzyme